MDILEYLRRENLDEFSRNYNYNTILLLTNNTYVTLLKK